MDEIEQIRKRKLEELQQQQQNHIQEQQQLNDQVAQLETMIKPLFTRDALSRFGNLKSAHPEKAVQVLVVIANLLQQNNIKSITDGQLRQLLIDMTPKKHEFKIRK